VAFSPGQSVVILGAARSAGNTRRVVESIVAGRPVEIVDVSQLRLSAYDYEHRNAGDDFLPLIEAIASKHLWILATPVYWHTMSAQLKLFVDRLGDLFTIREDLGRLLRGKSLALVASGTSPELPAGFELPFRLTCEYLGMRYLGAFYWRFKTNDRPFPDLAARARKVGAGWIS
jgi:NAD(P)H-dependent FMN reductase